MSTTDTRAKLIIHWLNNDLNLNIKKFEVASSDASFRRYFRVTHHQGQYIVMDAPPEKEDIKPFIRIATLLKKAGLNVPEIYHQNLDKGFLLLEDFGSLSFLDQLTPDTADTIYQSAFDCLTQLQANKDLLNSQLPLYDESLLTQELALFYDWFLAKQLKLTVPNKIKDAINQTLILSAQEQPQACVHRDFHSRNLMFLTENSPGIIDFQDAVIGPITYDLVSLLRDCYIAWPSKQVDHWVGLFFTQIKQAGLVTSDLATFTRWFDLMGLQRHLKVLGIFTRLHLRDNKSNYLQDIPLTLEYVRQICAKYPDLSEFNQYLTETIIPVYEKTQHNL